MKKLLKEKRKMETKPYSKLLLSKVYHIVRKVDEG